MGINKLATFAVIGAMSIGCTDKSATQSRASIEFDSLHILSKGASNATPSEKISADYLKANYLKNGQKEDFKCNEWLLNPWIGTDLEKQFSHVRGRVKTVTHCQPIVKTSDNCSADVLLDDKGNVLMDIAC